MSKFIQIGEFKGLDPGKFNLDKYDDKIPEVSFLKLFLNILRNYTYCTMIIL